MMRTSLKQQRNPSTTTTKTGPGKPGIHSSSERGQTLTEYSLIFAFIVILCLVALQTMSGAISAALTLIVPSL